MNNFCRLVVDNLVGLRVDQEWRGDTAYINVVAVSKVQLHFESHWSRSWCVHCKATSSETRARIKTFIMCETKTLLFSHKVATIYKTQGGDRMYITVVIWLCPHVYFWKKLGSVDVINCQNYSTYPHVSIGITTISTKCIAYEFFIVIRHLLIPGNSFVWGLPDILDRFHRHQHWIAILDLPCMGARHSCR